MKVSASGCGDISEKKKKKYNQGPVGKFIKKKKKKKRKKRNSHHFTLSWFKLNLKNKFLKNLRLISFTWQVEPRS